MGTVAPRGGSTGEGRETGLMNYATSGSMDRITGSKNKFKKQHVCLIGLLIAMAALTPYLLSHMNREMILAGACLTALVGMCLTVTLIIMTALAVLFKRLKKAG